MLAPPNAAKLQQQQPVSLAAGIRRTGRTHHSHACHTPRVCSGNACTSQNSASRSVTCSATATALLVPTTRGSRSRSEQPSSAASSPSASWLSSAMPQLVSHLACDGGAASIHLVSADPWARSGVDLQLVKCQAEGWSMLAKELSTSGAEGLIMARPISSPAEYCPLAPRSSPLAPNQQQYGASSSGGCSHDGEGRGDREAGYGSAAAVVAAAVAAATGASSGQARESQRGRSRASRSDRSSSGDTSSGEDGVSYFGLVVLSRGVASGASTGCSNSGCYVLKTSTTPAASAAGYRCTHYTLTQVCKGQPISSQMQTAWLV